MDIGKTLNYLFAGFVTVAIISVIVSKNSTTPGVLQSLGVALSTMFASIVAPVANNTAASHPPTGATGTWTTDPSNLTTMPSNVTPKKPSPHDASSATTQNNPAG